ADLRRLRAVPQGGHQARGLPQTHHAGGRRGDRPEFVLIRALVGSAVRTSSPGQVSEDVRTADPTGPYRPSPSIHARSAAAASTSTTFRPTGGILNRSGSTTRRWSIDRPSSPGATTRGRSTPCPSLTVGASGIFLSFHAIPNRAWNAAGIFPPGRWQLAQLASRYDATRASSGAERSPTATSRGNPAISSSRGFGASIPSRAHVRIWL